MIPKIARWIALIALFALPFLALYTSNSLYFPFITGKNFLFRILVELAFGGWVVLALADRRYRPRFSWTLVAFGLLVVWMAIADAAGVNAHKAFWSNYERMDGWVTLIHIFLLFLVAGSMFEVEKLWRRWWLTFVGASALVVGYAFLQLMGAASIHQSSTRIDSTLGNAEYLAGFLLFAIGAALWQALTTRRDQLWLRYSLYVLIVLDLIILVKTGTRGTFVGLAAAAVVGGFLWLLQSGKQGRRGALVFIAALVVLAGGYFSIRHAAFIQNDPTLSRIANISVQELSPRFSIWQMAIEGAKERPVLGWGQEGFNYIFNAHYIPSMYAQEQWFDRAHSVYLDYLVAGGIPALLLFLALFGYACYAVYTARERSRVERVLILAILAGYAVQGIVVFDNLFTYMPLVLLLAYAHTLRSRPMLRLERAAELRGSTLDAVVAPIALVAVLVIVYMVNVPSMRAASDIIDGLTPSAPADVRLTYFKSALSQGPFATQEIREQLLSFASSAVADPATSDPVKQEIVQYANQQIVAELALAPQDARLHIQYATFLRSVGQLDAARAESARARELSPQKQWIMVEQGAEAWQAHDTVAARGFFDEAYALTPQSDDFATYAAIGQIVNGDLLGGKQILQQHFGTTTVDNLMLALAYQETKNWNDLVAVMRLHATTQGDATSGYQLAIVYAQAGRLAEARTQTQAVMAAHPETASQGAALLTQIGQASTH